MILLQENFNLGLAVKVVHEFCSSIVHHPRAEFYQ